MPDTDQPQQPQPKVEVHLCGDNATPKKFVYRDANGKPCLAEPREGAAARALAVVLTMFRRLKSPICFRVTSTRSASTKGKCRIHAKKGSDIVVLVLGAVKDSHRNKSSRGQIYHLRDFLALFIPPPEKNRKDYVNLNVEKLSPAAVCIKWGIDEVTDAQELQSLAQRIANNAKPPWKLADYIFEPRELEHLDEARVVSDRRKSEMPESSATPSRPVEAIGNALIVGINQRATLDDAFVQMFDEPLLSNRLAGVVFAEWMNDADEWERVILERKSWINTHPEDLYCRAMLLWSILKKGNPNQMFEVLAETGRWLVSNLPDVSGAHGGDAAEILRQDIERTIDQITGKSVPHAGSVQWHVEDTLVRAALLRSLKFQRQPSQVMTEFARFGRDLKNQPVMKILLASTKEQRGDSWLKVAVQQVTRWVDLERESALGRLVFLWFIGRQGMPDQMESAIEQSSRWLARNPSQTVVRWATIWLGGLVPERELIIRLIDESERWLQEEAPDDERLVRHGLLWLVGERGNPAQVQQAIANTAGWLESHATDDFIRVAFLLFLIRRSGTVGQRKHAMATTRKWLRSSDDPYGLTSLALRFCESAAE